MMQTKEYSLESGGKKIIAEFSDLAENANGSVLMKSGDTAVLVTAVMSKNEEGTDYLPLTVDYEERFYAVGRILGSSFARREGKPADEAILAGRVIDRTIRPLFDQRIRHEIQVVATILSLGDTDPTALGVIGASLALGASDIPWNGPVSAIRVGSADGATFVFDSSAMERLGAALDMVVCGKDGCINMIEVGGKEVEETVLMAGLEAAHLEIERVQAWQKKIIAEVGKEKRKIEFSEPPEEVGALFDAEIAPKLRAALFSGPGHKEEYVLKDAWLALVAEKLEHIKNAAIFADAHFEEAVNECLHREAIENNARPDGRKMDEVRPLFAKAGGFSSTLHGTGTFYRGGTHILSVLTLGGPGDAQHIETIENHGGHKRFLHHYNFPPFSNGETGRLGGTNRRMVGHGALAEKALVPVIPPQDIFPYTIRVVSEALSSNGSTSMGSVCASTLALMDGGVPISAPVAGIATGLMVENTKHPALRDLTERDKNQNTKKNTDTRTQSAAYKILTDIQGPEDQHGDMDLKVAGTRKGITAVQMDVKVDGVPLPILAEAFSKARAAREKILAMMEKEIAAPRADLSPRAPKIMVLQIKKERIGLVIGPGGKTINEIKEKTGVEGIDIKDDGRVCITGKGGSAEKAAAIIQHLTRDYNKW